MDQERTDREGYWPPTVTQVLWWTMVIIIVLSIFVFVSPYYSDTLQTWLDIVVLPAAVVFLAFVLNEAVKAKDDAEKKRERDRDRRNAENENRKDFLMHVMRAYNGAKKVRRVLTAHESDDEKIPCSVYEAQMETLMDAQLELELYKRDESTMQPNALLPALEDEKKREEISNRVRYLEKYLNDIIRDYDKGYKGDYAKWKKELGLNSPSCQLPIGKLQKLKAFVETDSFIRDFSWPVHDLTKQIKEEIERAHSTGAK